MIKPETISKLEKTYHVRITRNHLTDTFDIYSCDNCHWACVAGYRSLVSELSASRDALRRIYERM